MSVAQTAERISKQAGNGSTLPFSGSWKIFAATDLKVYKIAADGTYSALLTNGVDYTVAFDTDAETWTVTYAVAPVNGGYAVIIGSAMPLTQASGFPREGVTPAATLKNALDKLTVLVQQNRDALDRAPKQPETPVNANNPIVIDPPVDRRAMVYEISGSDVTVVPSDNDPDEQATLAAAQAAIATAQAAISTAQAVAAAASAAAAAVSAALIANAVLSGLWAARPVAPTTVSLFYATDRASLEIYIPAAARWFLLG